MSENVLKVRIKQRYDTEANWNTKNPILLKGEVGYAENGKYKIGDGTSTWSALSYVIPTKADIGLGNVENKSSATIRGELTKANVTNALGYTPPTTNTTYGVATSSTLGLVKSGTDITVDSSGNVSVNDDSHNHVISNVDGLQSALDEKKLSEPTTFALHSNYVAVRTANRTASQYYEFWDSDVGWADIIAGNITSTGNFIGNLSGNADSASSVPWSGITGKPSTFTPSDHTHDSRYYTESEIDTKLNTKLNTSLKGAASGLAELDSTGRVPSSQLPSYVDDVIEGYLYDSKFYKESAHTTQITGETGKIYVDLTSNKTYRWSGSAFAVISETLALGETSTTAYRGDRGKIAYDHSQVAHAPSNAEVNQNAFSNVTVGSTTIAADSKTDTLTLVAGSNVTLTPDATNDKITISSTDTNTWRGIHDNLTSTSTTESLSANQGRLLANGSARDNTKLSLSGGNVTGKTTYSGGLAITSASENTNVQFLLGIKAFADGGDVEYIKSSDVTSLIGASPSNHTHISLKSNTDNRYTDTTPNDYDGVLKISGLKGNGIIGISGHGTYSGVLGMRPWDDSSGGNSHEFALTQDGEIFHRHGETTSWNSWRQIAFTSSNVASASKWATPRTLSLTGAVTGSVSIDGSGDMSLSTSVNHTHNYAGSDSAGGAATIANSLLSQGMLDTQEKIDNFITPNKLQYSLFKTNDTNNIGMVTNDGMLLSIPWSSARYGAQIAFDDYTDGTIKIRGKSDNWGSWYTLLHSGNYTNYTVTKTGSGASGTWGINITGSAGSVEWGNITGKPSTFAPASHTHSYAGSASAGGAANYLSVQHGNEINFTNTPSVTGLWFNYRNGDNGSTSNDTAITTYSFGNTNGSTSGVTLFADSFAGNSASASRLATARTISLTGSVTGSGTFDGSGDLTITTTTNHTHSYLPLTGGTLTGALQVNSTIFGYNFINNINAPAFVFDKYGSHYTGIGANAEYDTIFFGAVNTSDFSWNTSYKQIWKFNGNVIADSFNGNATSSNWLNENSSLTYGASGLQYFNQSTSTTSGADVNANPTNDWYHIIRMNHSNSSGYFVDLATCFHSNAMYYRRIVAGVENAWVRIIDSTNIADQNVASATKLLNSRTISLTGAVTGSGTFDGSGDLSISTTVSHTHNYAGSSSAGGSANSAVKLDSNAGSATQPIYFSGGKPTACSYTLSKSVPADAKFTDTTYSTGTESTSGLTKLYTVIGTATDGTMTQNAITTELNKKTKVTIVRWS